MSVFTKILEGSGFDFLKIMGFLLREIRDVGRPRAISRLVVSCPILLSFSDFVMFEG